MGEKRKTPDEALSYTPASLIQMMRYATKLDWLVLGVGVLASAVSGCMPTASTLTFRGITNTLITAQTEGERLNMDWFVAEMLYYVKFYFFAAVVSFSAGLIGMTAFFTVSQLQIHRIQKAFMRKILNHEATWLDTNEIGKLTQKMSSGMDRIRDGTGDKLALIVQSITAMICGLTTAFLLSWKMALGTSLIIPCVLLNILGSALTVRKFLRSEIGAYGAAGAVAEEAINGIRTVAAFNAQQTETERYGGHLRKGCAAGIRKAGLTALFAGIFQLIMFVSMGIAFWYGTGFVVEGEISPGTVFSVFWMVCGAAMRIGVAIPQIAVIMAAKLSAGEIFQMIDSEPSINCASPVGLRPDRVDGRIEFRNVGFRYSTRPEVPILQNLSFTVEPGQNIALVGHSGCGKSTIINLLMRFYGIEMGEITLDGIPLEKLNIEWLRTQIGIVSQEPIVFAATVEENLRLGKSDATDAELIGVCRMANAHEFIKTLPNGYQTPIGEGGVKLSGGQKQRLAIARALLRQPRILLLDEATSALDSESERMVQAAIEKASAGRTTITVAHRLSTIVNADRIIVFESGKIVETGTHRELMEYDGLYRQLVAAQEVEHLDDDGREEASRRRQIQAHDRRRSSDSAYSEFSRKWRSSLRSSVPFSDTSEIDEWVFLVNPKFCRKMDSLAEEREQNRSASLWQIWRFAAPEHPLLAVGLLATAARGAVWPVFSLIYGRFFKTLSEIESTPVDTINDELLTTAFEFIGLGVGAFGLMFLSGFVFGMIGERLTLRLRLAVFGNLLRQDGYYYDQLRHSTGKLTMRLATDAQNVQSAIDQRLADVLQGASAFICGIIVAFIAAPKMAPIGMVSPMFIIICQLFVITYARRRMHQDVKYTEEESRVASQCIESVRTIQSLTQQQYFYNLYCSVHSAPHRHYIIRGFLQALSYALTNTYTPMNFGLAYMFGAFMIRDGNATPYGVFQARLAAGLMFEMLNEKPRIDSSNIGGVVKPIYGDVQLDNVCFTYPNGKGTLVLNGLDLEVTRGQTVALVGASGCGKSTVIQLLERYYDVTAGLVAMDNVDIRERNLSTVRSGMSVVGQEPTLFNVSIAANIAYGLENATHEEIQKAAMMANIHKFVDSLPEKYETIVGSRGSQLSGGQKQRIAIARAIIRDPKILLLDEATSALDTESEKLVQDALDNASRGRTSLIIAHRLSTIQNADRILVIKDGRVVESGRHMELLAHNGLYHRLVQKQSGNP